MMTLFRLRFYFLIPILDESRQHHHHGATFTEQLLGVRLIVLYKLPQLLFKETL